MRVWTLALDQHPPIEERVGKDEARDTGRPGYGTVDPSDGRNSNGKTLVIEKERHSWRT